MEMVKDIGGNVLDEINCLDRGQYRCQCFILLVAVMAVISIFSLLEIWECMNCWFYLLRTLENSMCVGNNA